jgi:hypothetical protein
MNDLLTEEEIDLLNDEIKDEELAEYFVNEEY